MNKEVEKNSNEKVSSELLMVENYHGIRRLTLNNPPANTLSLAMLARLDEELDKIKDEETVRVVILAATGSPFSAGHDMREMSEHRNDDDKGKAFFEMVMRNCAQVMQKIVALPKPVIAEINGLATAAGCQLVASCDLAICTDIATFCTPGVNIGLFCSTPMVALSRNVSSKQAMEMLLTGETIDASTAKQFGLINRIVPREYLRQVVDKYAGVIASKSSATLKIGKEAFYNQLQMPLDEAYEYAAKVMVDNMLIADAEEGIGAFLEKRPAVWKDE